MAVIVELSLPSGAFELGRILAMEDDSSITLETMVPMGESPIPFFRVYRGGTAVFESRVRDHPTVEDVRVVNSHEDEVLYALDWNASEDAFLERIRDVDGQLLNASGSSNAWGFEIRFPTHEATSRFQETCHESNIPIDIKRIFNPTRPDAGPWYGLTPPQREMLTRAVERGYYSIPRGASTKEIASEFDISDQAVTERLRRAVVTLVTNTVLVTADGD